LGYYPSVYCGWFGCGWRFTLDEFQQARKGVARMDAKLFQEKNALDALEKADQTVVKAKQDYRTSNPTEKQGAIERWQQGMDTLQQVPPETLAGRQAKTKLIAYERDFEQATGSVAGASQTGDLVGAAQEFARIAQQSSMGETHTAAEWKEIQSQWQEAIERLEQVKPNEPGYPQAQKLLASYKSNLSKARIKEENELSSTEAYDRADTLRQQLLANVNRADSGYIASTLQQIRSELSKVKPGTTVYAEAQQLKSFADKRLKQYGLQ
jgi:cysteinyl-tRNA synthetase